MSSPVVAAVMLTEAHRLRADLARVTQPNWQDAVADMRQQLDGLVYRGFLEQTDADRLAHLPRYLKALSLRLEKLPGAAARDRQCMQEMAELQQQWAARDRQRRAQSSIDPRLDEIRWMLEELRVSLFAQALKTPQPVSVKRIRKRWESLGL